jgi:imidazolonepropionase
MLNTLPAADTLILDIDRLVPCAGPAPRRGPAQGMLETIANGAVAAAGGTIVFAGHMTDCFARVTRAPGATVLDGRGCTVLPGFVDPHTHVVYAGDRRDELRRRLAGATYAEIAAGGGGIVSTVQATRAATEAELVAASAPRLAEMLRQGTTTCEVKSGYGLETGAELRMLRAIRALAGTTPVELVPTFMGAHEVPVEHRADRRKYIDLVVGEMIPQVAAEGLAEWCDVFCETGVFTPDESAEILHAGLRHGLKARIHADELDASGGSLVAAGVGARSADHLIFVPPDGILGLASAGVVATLLPIAAFYLKLPRFAPARALVAAGVPVAIATDMNPGGGLSASMPFAMALACFGMHMTMEEAVIAATINAAFAIDRHERVGSLEAGKQLDAVVVRGDLVDLLRVGATVITHVVKKGRVVAC